MSEDAELQAKIAALSGKINQRKQNQYSVSTNTPYQAPYYAAHAATHRGRRAPYASGHTGRGAHQTHFKNRSLVLKSHKPAASASTIDHADAPTPADAKIPEGGYVTARGPGKNELMSKNTYEREQRQKQEHVDRRKTKRHRIDLEEKQRVVLHVQGGVGSSAREILVEGIRFQLRDDGSKLTRISDPTITKETPKKVKIADIEFRRTKNGNLLRAMVVKDLSRQNQLRQKSPCEHFAKHGKCPFGPACRFAHDPNNVAICKDFLHAGTCPAGNNCDMSHETTYHRVPACTHFLRGNCTNDACRYPHVHVSPSAPVCRPFATLGFCAKGDKCDRRHVFECPDYANHGVCALRESGKCPLPHPDRASTLRKVAHRQAKTGEEDETDISSDEEVTSNDADFDDVDSDDVGDVVMGGHEAAELVQQEDFIALG